MSGTSGSEQVVLRRDSTEEMMEDFDDQDTDERLNLPVHQIIYSKELEWFPDPLTHCLGFIITDDESNFI